MCVNDLQVSLIGQGQLEDSVVRDNGKGGPMYKYGGGCLAPDGRIYCFPSDADRVLRIDPTTDEVVCIGPSFASQVCLRIGGRTIRRTLNKPRIFTESCECALLFLNDEECYYFNIVVPYSFEQFVL